MKLANTDSWEKLEKIVEEWKVKYAIPGCSIGILQGGEIRTAGFGLSHAELGRKVSADTLFQIGSITKTFTATLAMKLVEEGRLDLLTPVRTYLPDFKVSDEYASNQVTPFHLLTHSAGWDGDLFIDTGDGEDAIFSYVAKMADREQIFPLGQFFSYNNAGFAVLGAVLEQITGKPLEDLFRSYILHPLGLKNVFFNAGEVISYDFAVGHQDSDQDSRVARPWNMPRCVLPMGALVTTPRDLLKFAQCYLEDGRTPDGQQMLKPETIMDMFSSKIPISPEDKTSTGYSWRRRDIEQGILVGHGGGTNGQISQLSMLPEQGFAFAIFTNSEKGDRLIAKLHQFILEEFVNVTYELPKAISSTPDQLAGFEGTASRPGFKFTLRMIGDQLVGMEEITIGFPTEKDPPPPPSQPVRVGRCGEDRLIILDGEYKDSPIDIFRDSQGIIRYMRLGRMYNFTPQSSEAHSN